MKRNIPVLLLLLASLPVFLVAAGSPPKTRVAYVPLVNVEKAARYQGICSAVTDTLSLNLGLVPRFFVLEAPIDPYRQYDQVERYAEKNAVDYLVFGKIMTGRSGEILMQMSVYSKSKNAITVTRDESAKSIFGVFAAANRLVSSVVKDFSGLTIGFGVLEVVNTGEEGSYELFLDGESMGLNVRGSRRVFNGARQVEVKQKRMLGEEVIFSKQVRLEDGKETRVEFAVPYLLPNEKSRVQNLEDSIEGRKEKRSERERVLRTYGELLSLFQDVSYCTRLAEERERIRQHEVEYRLETIGWEIENDFLAPKNETFDKLEKIWDARTTYLDPSAVETKVIESSEFLFTVLDLNASHEISRAEWPRALDIYNFMERIVQKIPLERAREFEEDRGFIEKTWRKYEKKNERSETFAEIMIGVRMAKRFKDRIQSAERFYEGIDETVEKELVVFSCPPGLDVVIGAKNVGTTPIRVKEIREQTAEVSVRGPWHSEQTRSVILEGLRTVFYVSSFTGGTVLSAGPVEVVGKEKLKLAWSEVPDVKGYRVQVDEAGGNFTKPLADMKGLRENFVLYQKKLKKGDQYVYRVQAVTKDDRESTWAYSEPFSP